MIRTPSPTVFRFQRLISGALLGLPMLAIALPLVPTVISAPALHAQTLPPPVATLTPVNGKVNIRFINQTGAVINYQVVGDTDSRTLAGQSETTLDSLPVPTSLTFRREDAGLLDVSYQVDNPTGTLTLTVKATTSFEIDRTSVYVDKNGSVYFN